jgi:hypothetical protein
MNEQQTNEQAATPTQTSSPQQRLRELLAIPDNQKTEAQWDELIELEIALAQGGRPINMGNGGSKSQGQAQQARKQNAKPQAGGGGQPKKPLRKFRKRPAKAQAPQ